MLSLVLVVSFVGWALSFMGGSSPIRQLQPIPDDVPPQDGAVVPVVDFAAGGRVSEQLFGWAEPLSSETSIPVQALAAYAMAQAYAEQTWPSCHINWTTLAGLGYVETRHGTYTGRLFTNATLDDEGVATPPIYGIPLDGSPGVADIPDTDNGELDGDPEHDRAMGPMQFIPTSWQRYAVDGNGDGVLNPQQIDDAALSAAQLLCDGRDLATPEGWSDAIYSYNMSSDYLVRVRDAANSYALGQPAV